MFGSIGIPELLIILVVALLVIGPKRLPEVAKSIGRSLRDLKRATSDLQDSISLDDIDNDPYPTSNTEEDKGTKSAAASAPDETAAPEDTAAGPDETAAPENTVAETSAPDTSPDASPSDVSEKGKPAS